jgi:hypothetical protein
MKTIAVQYATLKGLFCLIWAVTDIFNPEKLSVHDLMSDQRYIQPGKLSVHDLMSDQNLPARIPGLPTYGSI